MIAPLSGRQRLAESARRIAQAPMDDRTDAIVGTLAHLMLAIVESPGCPVVREQAQQALRVIVQ